jgi:DNA polymerase elongation subunit (family B)
MPSISFQVIDIIARDEVVLREDEETREVMYESDSGSDSDYESKRRSKANAATEKKSLEINLFGRTSDGHAVRLDVKGFRPSFALRLPLDGSTSQYMAALKEYVKKSGVPVDQIGWRLEQKKVFYGFTADRLFPFIVVDTPSMALFRRMKNLFLNEKSQYATRRPLGAPWKRGQVPEVFDASLDPMLRFLHWRDIDPCGWVKATVEEAEDDGHYQCDWEDVGRTTAPAGCAIAPFKKVFWDIECMSYSGEFPLAIASYQRTAKEALAIVGSVPLQDSIFSCFSGSITKGMSIVRWKNRKLNLEKVRAALMSETAVTSFNKMTLEYSTANKEEREDLVSKLAAGLGRLLGGSVSLAGDEIIQIGQVVVCGDRVENHLFAWPDCAPIDGVMVHSYATETEMLAGWCEWIAAEDPDELIGYNVFGFDERYFHQRMEENNMTDLPDYQKLNRLSGDGAEMILEEKRLASSAMGDNYLYTWRTQGRLQIDLLHYVRRTNAGLTSYTLDNVAHHYLSADVAGVTKDEGRWLITLKRPIKEAKAGRAVVLIDALEETICDKLEVLEVLEGGVLCVAADPDTDWGVVCGAVKCSMGKDDLPPKEIFRHQLGGPKERAVIGKYCIQDCALTVDLYKKLETFANAMAMANICSVPIAYIFTRGQGIKAESLMFREAWKRGQRIQVQEAPSRGFASQKAVAVIGDDGEEIKEEPEDSYEGAIVLTPVPGMYRNVGVCDFASLYPSTMVSENISHDSLVWAKDYDLEGRLVGISWGSEEYDKLDGWRYTDIDFDILKPDPEDKRKNPKKIKTGLRVCRYAQPAGDAKSTVPQVIQMLLAARKAKRKEAEKETDPARANLLDVEQLNYKLTANSLYGQLGSGTFKVRLQHCAASITAYGRKQIMFAKEVIERFYGSSDGSWKDARGKATIVYGDTDSLFIGWDLPANVEKGVPSREKVIELTKEAGQLVTQVLKVPHDFEYEKIFDPMLLYTKKRYAGNKYDFDPTKFKLTSMGIATKRRDYSPIVKTIYSGALRRLLDHQDVVGAAEFVRETAMDLVEGRISWPQLTITKSLRSDYADPKRIAHKVLADRIAVRDPGNAPASGDRIGYMFIRPSSGQLASKLQGDRIETPSYARERKLTPDYQAYIENQIAKPVSQMFALVVEQIPGYEDVARRVCGEAWGKRKKEDMDALKEVIARELLFSVALHRLNANEKVNFIAKQFRLSDEQIAAASAASATVPRAKRAVKVALAPEIKKAAKEVVKQGTLMDYMFDKMLLSKPRQKKKNEEEGSVKA